jgi:hypothetical protein
MRATQPTIHRNRKYNKHHANDGQEEWLLRTVAWLAAGAAAAAVSIIDDIIISQMLRLVRGGRWVNFMFVLVAVVLLAYY